jgi:hypothetical protein
VRKTIVFACLLTVCNLTLFGQISTGPRAVHIKEKSAIHVPPQETPEALKKIYGNLGTSKTDLYDDADSWAVSGPNSEGHVPFFIALPFTPKSNSHVFQVQAAVQYESGANQVNLSIYGDSGGVPGTLLAGPVTVTNLPEVGTCCILAVANFSSVEVTGGSRYWVVADTPLSGTGSDFVGFWSAVAKPVIPIASNIDGAGWLGLNADGLLAGEVLGTIP